MQLRWLKENYGTGKLKLQQIHPDGYWEDVPTEDSMKKEPHKHFMGNGKETYDCIGKVCAPLMKKDYDLDVEGNAVNKVPMYDYQNDPCKSQPKESPAPVGSSLTATNIIGAIALTKNIKNDVERGEEMFKLLFPELVKKSLRDELADKLKNKFICSYEPDMQFTHKDGWLDFADVAIDFLKPRKDEL